MKLAMIVRMDKTGLGNQTRELAYMLKPDKILIINSSYFKPRTEQYPEWYKDFYAKGITKRGFPTVREKLWLLQGVDRLITCEIPYGYDILGEANRRGIKTYLQYNYEFLDYLRHPVLPKPDVFISPTSWGVEEVQKKLDVSPIILRPPISLHKFSRSREINRNRTGKRRFLHIQGIKAAHDRNGTETLIKTIENISYDFELVIKVQGTIEKMSSDPRITYDNTNPVNNEDLYENFDALILPRRYGGLCLPMNEALASGLPVIMPDILPNYDMLPRRWLVKAKRIDTFMARTEIDIYEADVNHLTDKITNLIKMSNKSLIKEKDFAFQLASDNISSEILLDKYKEILK